MTAAKSMYNTMTRGREREGRERYGEIEKDREERRDTSRKRDRDREMEKETKTETEEGLRKKQQMNKIIKRVEIKEYKVDTYSSQNSYTTAHLSQLLQFHCSL